MVYLTDETITYIINGYDRDYNLATPSDDPLHKNILLSEDFGINMGSYLDNNVAEYYCEVIQYVYHCYNDGANFADTTTNVNFTQLYSNLAEKGRSSNLQTNLATFPLTQPTSTKNNSHLNNTYNGFTRNNVGQLQKNSFTCKNFNQQVKYFRLASMRYSNGYGFYRVSSRGKLKSYSDGTYQYAFSANLNKDGATGTPSAKVHWLKNFPHAIMYMTPIYKDRVPRLLENNNALTLTLTSQQRKIGAFGVDCVIPIPRFNSHYKKFKAVFQTLNILGDMAISNNDKKLCNFPFHFVCYNWDKSNYGYGGDRQGNGFILTTNSVTFNYQDASSSISKLSSTNGSIITINNENQDVRFQFLTSQMIRPSTENLGSQQNVHGFLYDANPIWEWTLTMKLYGIE